MPKEKAVLVLDTILSMNRVLLCGFQLLLHLPYSRKLELEADQVGLQLIAKVMMLFTSHDGVYSVLPLTFTIRGERAEMLQLKRDC